MVCARVHPADIADRDGAVPLLTAARRRFGSLRLLWADMGCRGRLVRWVQEHLAWTVDVVQKPRRWLRVPEGAPVPFVPAFTVLAFHVIVHQTGATSI